MKRSGKLRHRSRTNSRPWENRALRQQYRDDNPDCELSDGNGDDLHHIWGGNPRWDVWSNFIRLSREQPDRADTPDGPALRLECMATKLWKDELDVEELHKASKQHPIGWVENQPWRGPHLIIARLFLRKFGR